MHDESTLALYLLKLLDVLKEQGIAVNPILNRAGVTARELEHRESELPISKYINAVDIACQQSGLVDLGFQVGEHTSPLEHGVFGYALLSSPTLLESLQRYIRYQNLPGPLLDIQFEHDTEEACLVAVPRVDAHSLTPICVRYFVQEWLVGWNQWSPLIGLNRGFFDYVTLGFEPLYNAAQEKALYEQHLGCEVSFGGETTRALFPASHLNRSLEYAEKRIGAYCAEQCEQLLATLKLQRGLTADIHRHLTSSPGNPPKMQAMAEKLCLSVRTLRRRLLEEGTTYQQLVVEFRMAMARRYLLETPLAANDIAELVGYSDTANFYHTFRKETGTTPQQFRALVEKGTEGFT